MTKHDPSTSCAAPSSPLLSTPSASPTCPRKRHIVTGTFNSPNLFTLLYDPLSPTPLSILHSLPAQGPHQYTSLALTSSGTSTVYATTWADPPTLSSWHVQPDYSLSFGNSVPITATGSYVHTQPPPYSSLTAPSFGSVPGVGRWLGSAGGPTGELHKLDTETGLIGEKVKELIFLPGGEGELEGADKTRKALRYGAHSFDCSSNSEEGEEQVAYVADLGSNSVKAYSFPALDLLYEVKSAREGDGPRHSIPHPHLPVLFTVTEHSNYVDAYAVPSGKHLAEADMLTPSQAEHRHDWRGDTLRFSSDLKYLFASTRGKSVDQKGILLAYKLTTSSDRGELGVDLKEVARFETRTSGGKANAIELAPGTAEGEPDLMILTDDEEGWLDVISFTPEEKFRVEASAKLPALENGDAQGASHAIWLN